MAEGGQSRSHTVRDQQYERVQRIASDRSLDVALFLKRKQPLPPSETMVGRPRTIHELTRRHGPNPDAVAAAKGFVRQLGIARCRVDAPSASLRFTAPVRTLEAAFRTELFEFRGRDGTPGAGERIIGPARPIEIPGSLEGHVVAVLGLDQFPRLRRRFSTADNTLSILQTAKAYGIPTAADLGAKRPAPVALLEFGGDFLISDIATYVTTNGLGGVPPITNISVNGAGLPPGATTTIEVGLDIEIVVAVAQGAPIIVYWGQAFSINLIDAILAAANDTVNAPTVISSSYGGFEASWPSAVMDLVNDAVGYANARGVTVFFPAGDNGDQDQNPFELDTDFPGTCPNAVCVGGTNLTLPTPATPAIEVVWNDGSNATGGGVSRQFGLPSYQAAVGVPPPPPYTLGPISVSSPTGGRGVPDVTAHAAGYGIVLGGGGAGAFGTSGSTPFWAAMMAVLQNDLGIGPMGFINPTLYAAGAAGGCFNDITVGNNHLGSGTAPFAAAPGWDPVSGWGSPIYPQLRDFIGKRGRFGALSDKITIASPLAMEGPSLFAALGEIWVTYVELDTNGLLGGHVAMLQRANGTLAFDTALGVFPGATPSGAFGDATYWFAYADATNNDELCVLSAPYRSLTNQPVFSTLDLGEQCLVGTGPSATSFNDVIYVAWTGTDGRLNIKWNWQTPGGTPSKTTLEEFSDRGPTIATIRGVPGSGVDGGLMLAWVGTDGELNVMTASPNGGFGPKATIAEFSSQPLGIVGDSATGNQYLAWTGTDGALNVLLNAQSKTTYASETTPLGVSLVQLGGEVLIGWLGADNLLNIATVDPGMSAAVGVLTDAVQLVTSPGAPFMTVGRPMLLDCAGILCAFWVDVAANPLDAPMFALLDPAIGTVPVALQLDNRSALDVPSGCFDGAETIWIGYTAADEEIYVASFAFLDVTTASPFTSLGEGSVFGPSLAYFNNTPYIAWVETDGSISIAYGWAGGTTQKVTLPASASAAPRLVTLHDSSGNETGLQVYWADVSGEINMATLAVGSGLDFGPVESLPESTHLPLGAAQSPDARHMLVAFADDAGMLQITVDGAGVTSFPDVLTIGGPSMVTSKGMVLVAWASQVDQSVHLASAPAP